MAAKILQLANSAFVGASGRVSSLQQALTLIGTETVRTLVLSVHVFAQFDGNKRVAANLPALWEHSVAVSILAQQIAVAEGCAKGLIEECFTAGLLHDIGKVVLLAELPLDYLEVCSSEPGEKADRERALMGCTHAEVGAYLMSIWGLPFSLVRAVAYHHHPGETAETKFSSLTAVHIADVIASGTDTSAVNHDIELDMEYLERLGVRGKEDAWRSLHAKPAQAQTPQNQSTKS
jgi:HD-like signal output (HDOD) protein